MQYFQGDYIFVEICNFCVKGALTQEYIFWKIFSSDLESRKEFSPWSHMTSKMINRCFVPIISPALNYVDPNIACLACFGQEKNERRRLTHFFKFQIFLGGGFMLKKFGLKRRFFTSNQFLLQMSVKISSILKLHLINGKH